MGSVVLSEDFGQVILIVAWNHLKSFPGGSTLSGTDKCIHVCKCIHVSCQVSYMKIQFHNLGVQCFKSKRNKAGNLAQLAKCLPVYRKP